MELTRRGWFIALEGPDGAGKSGAAAALVEHLRATGRGVTSTREPGGTSLGERVRAILLNADPAPRVPEADAFLFNAARSQLVREVIVPALARGDMVVCDRFAGSTLAYQGYGAGVDLETLRWLERLSVGAARPDLVILLDVPVAVGLARRSRGDPKQLTRFEDEALHDTAFHGRVRAGFLALAADDPERWRVVDGDRHPAAVHSAIRATVDEFLALSEPQRPAARMQS
jgi:dTMP kinase